MTKRRFAVWGLILALCTGTTGMTTAYAADKTISSVKLQIYTDLEVGDKIGDASIDIDSTTAPGGGIAISGSTERYQIMEAGVDHLFFQRSKCGLPARVENPPGSSRF